MSVKRARLYDGLALLLVIVIIGLDQWTKSLVVERLQLGSEVPFPFLGHYLVFQYIQNNGAAFSMLKNNVFLAVFIVLAIGVVIYLYARIANSGPLLYKLVFGLIIGGALGNLLDRFFRGGYVVDFVSFRIPEIHFFFAIFNVADACISVGVVLLFVLALFGGLARPKPGEATTEQREVSEAAQQPGKTNQ